MKSNWLHATLHISPEELRTLDWVEAITLAEEELPYLTNQDEYDIIDNGELELLEK